MYIDNLTNWLKHGVHKGFITARSCPHYGTINLYHLGEENVIGVEYGGKGSCDRQVQSIQWHQRAVSKLDELIEETKRRYLHPRPRLKSKAGRIGEPGTRPRLRPTTPKANRPRLRTPAQSKVGPTMTRPTLKKKRPKVKTK